MDLRLLKQVNDLWSRVYPYLADHVMEHYGRNHGDVLELGPFAGGISLELAKRHPRLNITVVAEDLSVVELLHGEIEKAALDQDVEVRRSSLNPIDFDDSVFDLVIFRGAYFFLDEEGSILREIYRVLREGGIGFIGGGYGKNTPQGVIDEIADVSRDLNDRLGRIRVSMKDVQNMVNKSGMTFQPEIQEEGGLWLIIRK